MAKARFEDQRPRCSGGLFQEGKAERHANFPLVFEFDDHLVLDKLYGDGAGLICS
jgi:hypothetical protein